MVISERLAALHIPKYLLKLEHYSDMGKTSSIAMADSFVSIYAKIHDVYYDHSCLLIIIFSKILTRFHHIST